MSSYAQLIEQDFGTIAELIHAHAVERPTHPALIKDDAQLDYASLDALMDRIAASLQRDGLRSGDVIGICALSSVEYGAVYLGALRAGVAVAPLAPSSTAEGLAMMLADCGARLFFIDESVAKGLGQSAADVPRIALDGSPVAGKAFQSWLAPAGAKPVPVAIDPTQAFNIIYSSGTTGAPKGIVQPHLMRWGHVRRAKGSDAYVHDSVTIISTPLYSNTTLVSFFPTIANGGTAVLMSKFDAVKFLELAQRYRATTAMLVPVQYQRIMDVPTFDSYDLKTFRMKFCTSAPFAAALKADILKRWPGGLVEYYGMTEGGGTCVLSAHEFPHKLHTVGQPAPNHDIRLIDEEGREVARGEIGEVVGRSGNMMVGYHNQPKKTSEAEWYDPQGNRFIRTGDVGRFDEEGFLTLMDRKKDMIISGGFNVYPSDLEAVLFQHAAVKDAAVVGVASRQWGETPVAFVVLGPDRTDSAEEIRSWVNERLGKTQRITALEIMDSLPRSAIGKVLKRELRDQYNARLAQSA